MRSLLVFLYLSLVWTKGAGASDPALPFMEYLDNDHLVCLKWGFDKMQGSITFKLVVNTTGWVGFGLSPNGGMKGSDIVIGGFGPSGNYFTVSHYQLLTTNVDISFMFSSILDFFLPVLWAHFLGLIFLCSTANRTDSKCFLLSIRIFMLQGTPCL